MSFARRIGAVGAATAVTAAVFFAGLTSLASAAPITVTVADQTLTPAQNFEASVTGCAVGSTLDVTLNGTAFSSAAVAADPTTVTIPFASLEAGDVNAVVVTCTPTGEAASSATVEAYAFGAVYLEADPETFFSGDTVKITAGDFLPGESVRLELYSTSGGDAAVFTKVLGTAGEDFSVSGSVVFPTTLPCGDYDIVVTDGDNEVTATLYMCTEPSATPSATATATATASASVEPTASASSTPTRSPSRPGLPSTGH